jgi:hypothetical protein
MVHSEGGRVEVDSGRKRMVTACSEGGRVEVDSLRKTMAMARSKAGVEVVACYEAGDEAATCSGTRIEDGRRRQHRRQAAVARWFLG